MAADVKERTVIQMRGEHSSSSLRKYPYDLKMRAAIEDHGTEAVVMDMTGWYREAVRDWLPSATVVVDRFHIVQKANDAVQKVQRSGRT